MDSVFFFPCAVLPWCHTIWPAQRFHRHATHKTAAFPLCVCVLRGCALTQCISTEFTRENGPKRSLLLFALPLTDALWFETGWIDCSKNFGNSISVSLSSVEFFAFVVVCCFICNSLHISLVSHTPRSIRTLSAWSFSRFMHTLFSVSYSRTRSRHRFLIRSHWHFSCLRPIHVRL